MRALALALLSFSVVLSGAARRPATVFDLSDAVGKPVPAVQLTAGDGSVIPLDARGKPTYVFLFAGWCGPCREELPFIRGGYAKYGDRVRFVGVDVLEDAEAAKTAIASVALPFAVAIYPIEELDAIVAPDIQARSGSKYRIPAAFLLDGNGVVRYAWHGLPMSRDGEPVDVLPDYLAKLGIQ